MHARVSTYAGSPDQAEAGVRNFEGLTDSLRSLEGLRADTCWSIEGPARR